MSGPFDFLHIKGRTAGSSNELSFDVLDAARNGIEQKKPSKSPGTPGPKQGSYHGVAGTSTLSATPEVERRKHARRARSIRMGVLSFLVIAALATAGVFAGIRFYDARVGFDSRFNALIDQFIAVDQTLARIDQLMADPLNSVELDERSDMLDTIPTLETSLDNISSDAADLESAAVSDDDRSALGEVDSAIDARKEMLSAAEDAFTFSAVVNKQSSEGNEAWNMVLAADETAREATNLANEASTEEATLKARDKTEEAITNLTTARDDLDMLVKEATGLDLTLELAYIDKRLEALEAAVDTSDALLANDRAAAEAANDAYNTADKAAATLAVGLTTSIGDKVRDLHEDVTQRAAQRYFDARSRATTADSAIRSRL